MTLDTNEATNRTMDRLFASASRKRPAERPNAEPGDPMTIIEADGVYLSQGPADIQAVLDELAIGAPCGICHNDRCTSLARGLIS